MAARLAALQAEPARRGRDVRRLRGRARLGLGPRRHLDRADRRKHAGRGGAAGEPGGRGAERASSRRAGTGADRQGTKLLAVAAAILVAAAFVIALLAVGRGATALVDGAPPSARVSLSGGVWSTVLAVYVAAFGVSAGLPRRWTGIV